MTGVVVVGGGPAGRALAAACARRGLDTALVDLRPDRPWRATYAAWADELPEGAPVAVTAKARAFTTAEHVLERDYAVLDNHRLRLLPPEVVVVRGKVVERTATGVRLADGRFLGARVVVDASGARGGAVEQTAVGVVVSEADAEPFVARGEAVVMDWRRPPDARTPDPTFLYAVPLGPDRVLLEETSLARAPGLPLAELRLRLHARLAAHGIRPPAEEERVRIPMDAPRAHSPAFGAAAGLVHPATGYSVATSLRWAPAVAEAIATGARGDVLWSPSAKTVHALRRRGLAVLLGLPPNRVPEFFRVFFDLSGEDQRNYLSQHDDLRGAMRAMTALFRAAPWSMRGHMAFSTRPRKGC
ncbi:lycopene cyclase family protein [Saccharothrix coeruleofusca]|uniref:Carotenoid cyclase n=1 Tax=Saccharothrix coeruleofusca TaxID=33919 RepID=A0A918AQA5_9PSEU|nr:lycopene cyclase family protein [Saccharothrix coeruleofusca]GGP61934.1 putative carotenoid cyclase [Saccharothrix coeruleofusca]